MRAGQLKDRIRIEKPVPEETFDGAGAGGWIEVARVRADVQDVLPSRGERLAEGISVATRPSRVRIRNRDGITAAMRIVVMVGDADVRIAQLVTQPAIIGRRRWLEFMVEDYSTAGNAA